MPGANSPRAPLHSQSLPCICAHLCVSPESAPSDALRTMLLPPPLPHSKRPMPPPRTDRSPPRVTAAGSPSLQLSVGTSVCSCPPDVLRRRPSPVSSFSAPGTADRLLVGALQPSAGSQPKLEADPRDGWLSRNGVLAAAAAAAADGEAATETAARATAAMSAATRVPMRPPPKACEVDMSQGCQGVQSHPMRCAHKYDAFDQPR